MTSRQLTSMQLTSVHPTSVTPTAGDARVTSLAELWHRVTGTQTAPSRNIVIVVAVVAFLLVALPRVWRISRNAITIAHEGGHAVVALATGRRLAGVSLHSDTSGVTVSYGKPRGLGMVLTSAAGYVTPSLLGLGGAYLLTSNHITGLLWAVILLLAAILIMIRNVYGLLSVIIAGAAVFAVSWFASSQLQAVFAYLVVSFLLLAGVKPVAELSRRRVKGRGGDSDADQLARLTRLPAALWVAFFFLVALGCLAVGGRWLLHL